MYKQEDIFVSADTFIQYHLMVNDEIVTSDGETGYLILFD